MAISKSLQGVESAAAMVDDHIPPPDSNALALERTFLAHERTLMAWVRTATSMVAFGFTVYKFFEFQKESVGVGLDRFTPRGFAIFIVSIGFMSLVAAMVQHHIELKRLWAYMPARPLSLAQLVAGLISFFAIAVLLAAILNF